MAKATIEKRLTDIYNELANEEKNGNAQSGVGAVLVRKAIVRMGLKDPFPYPELQEQKINAVVYTETDTLEVDDDSHVVLMQDDLIVKRD